MHPMTRSLNATASTTSNDRLTGIVLLAITAFVILFEWSGNTACKFPAAVGVVAFVIASTPRVSWSRRVFILTALALTISACVTRADWLAITSSALNSAAFIAAFFTALTSLRSASASSPAIEKCGHFLAEQPPGRRYIALTIGGHLFALVLNYGSISLLGNLAEASARREPNDEIRQHRVRRMMLAIQRGFVSTLPWSPLTFAIAISTSLVPGASWANALGYCLVSALILAGLGWAIDTIFKPRLSVPVPSRQKPRGTWASLLPLLALLALLVTIVGALHFTTGIRAVGVVMLVVPIISISWIALQNSASNPVKRTSFQIARYTALDLPSYRSELVLLTMAGFIGTMGSKLLSPIVVTSGIDLTTLPNWLVLIALVWIIPLAGQIGMNPILSVSLIAPLLPTAAAMGITPAALVTALTAGWALSGASSPFTATTMLVGNIARVSAWRVGLSWNGAYTVLSALTLSAWVAYVALHLDRLGT
jgi:hypothetical protein